MILASTEGQFYAHGFLTFLLVGIVFTAVGYGVGWLAWNRLPRTAKRIENENELLEADCQEVRENLIELKDELKRQRSASQ